MRSMRRPRTCQAPSSSRSMVKLVSSSGLIDRSARAPRSAPAPAARQCRGGPAQQDLHPFARDRRYRQRLVHATLFQCAGQLGPGRPHVRQVHLVEHDNLRLVHELGVEQLQFLVDGLVIAQGIWADAVQQVNEHARALDVAQERMPQAYAGVGALDQPRDIGQDDLAVVYDRHAQARLQSSEGIIGDLRPGCAHPATAESTCRRWARR